MTTPEVATNDQKNNLDHRAQSMMANGGLESLMANPMLQQMMSGGGMPDMAALMSDPSIRAMADQMGAMGGPGGARGGGGSDGPEDMYS